MLILFLFFLALLFMCIFFSLYIKKEEWRRQEEEEEGFLKQLLALAIVCRNWLLGSEEWIVFFPISSNLTVVIN